MSEAARRWIAIDSSKVAIDTAKKRLIEAGARPFTVESMAAPIAITAPTVIARATRETLTSSPFSQTFSKFERDYIRACRERLFTITLEHVAIDLDVCLQTQPDRLRGKIRAALEQASWRALVDTWAVDAAYREGQPFCAQWYTFRTRKHRELVLNTPVVFVEPGVYHVAVLVTDIFHHDGMTVIEVDASD